MINRPADFGHQVSLSEDDCHVKRTLLLGCAFLLAAPLFADTLAINYLNSQEKFKFLDLVGWTFDVVEDYHGTALGYFDASPENSPTVHEVGVFDSLQNLIVSAVIEVDDPLISHWRWHSVDFNLPVGMGYVVVTLTELDDTAKKADNFVTDPFLNIVGIGFTETASSLQYPASCAPPESLGDIFLAPNMMRADATSEMPEPGTWVLLASGGVAMGLTLRKRRPRSPNAAISASTTVN